MIGIFLGRLIYAIFHILKKSYKNLKQVFSNTKANVSSDSAFPYGSYEKLPDKLHMLLSKLTITFEPFNIF